MNYYNEFDPKAAAWIQQLIDDKQIPYGYVDSRSILEVQPSDLSGFTQCHFFAGVGGWSLALRLAGWSDDRPVWTASLPCQPFSTAGKQLGTDDERHLSPTFLELVRQCRPARCFGEQVASKLARTDWLPGIRLELEALGYSFGAADLCAPCAGEIGEGWIVRGDQESWERVIIGHPHIRQRLYWVADRRVEHSESERKSAVTEGTRQGVLLTDGPSSVDGLAHTDSERRSRIDSLLRTQEGRTDGTGDFPEAAGCGEDVGLPDTAHVGRSQSGKLGSKSSKEDSERKGDSCGKHPSYRLIPCRDGKTRRTESGIFPLVNGIPRGVVPSGDPSDPSYANVTAEARAVRLKGYGNAIVPPLAAMFIRTYMEVTAP